jgi:uncharacterized protein YciI
MSRYSVIREAGSDYLDGGIAAQPDIAQHAAFMNALAKEGSILFAGPLADTETGRLRALLIMNAEGEDEIHDRLGGDPSARANRLVITSIELWNVIVGTGRLALPSTGTPTGAPEPT